MEDLRYVVIGAWGLEELKKLYHRIHPNSVTGNRSLN